MAAAVYNIEIEQGSTWSQEVIWKNNDNSPVNVTGYSASMQIRTTIASPTSLMDLTSANSKIVVGGVNGKFTITITAAEAAALSWVTAVYDLEIISPGGTVIRILKGSVTVDPEVTRL